MIRLVLDAPNLLQLPDGVVGLLQDAGNHLRESHLWPLESRAPGLAD